VRGPGEVKKMKNKRESRGRKVTKHREGDKIRTRDSRRGKLRNSGREVRERGTKGGGRREARARGGRTKAKKDLSRERWVLGMGREKEGPIGRDKRNKRKKRNQREN